MTTMTDLPLPVQRMESAFDDIVNFEDAWDQHRWRRPDYDNACGTALCFAGWATTAAGYEPFIELIPGTNGMQGLSVDLNDFVIVPGDDPIAEGLHGVNPLHHVWSPDAEAYVRRRLEETGKDSVIAEIQYVADALLDIDRSLSRNVFNEFNNLATIRGYIDRARQYHGLQPRDFSTEPVLAHLDSDIPKPDRDTILARVASFNERATQPDPTITTTDGR